MIHLKDIAHGRSGDKGDTANIGVIARDNGPPALLLGLADGSLVVIRRD